MAIAGPITSAVLGLILLALASAFGWTLRSALQPRELLCWSGSAISIWLWPPSI